jgi:hypothetical protein
LVITAIEILFNEDLITQLSAIGFALSIFLWLVPLLPDKE